MRIPRFFHSGELQEQCEIQLATTTSHHINNVLRLKIGDPLIIFNGKGGEYSAHIIKNEKKYTTVLLKQFHVDNRESHLSIALAVALTRGEKMDLIIQKAVELGVNNITPLITERVKLRLNKERQQKRLVHWEGIIINACEQSGRCKIPTIQYPTLFTEFLSQPIASQHFILDPKSTNSWPQQLEPQFQQKVSLLVGPEGGFSEKEITLANQYQCRSVQMGPRILRMETAVISALSLCQHLWGDFTEIKH